MSGSAGHRDKAVKDYVRNRADDEAARQLEIEMLEDDELFDAVQTETLLREGMGTSAQTEATDASGRRGGWMAPAGWALAATFAAAAVLLGLYATGLQERVESLEAPSAGLPVVTLFDQRSTLLGEAPAPQTLQTGATGALIEIDVSAAGSETYALTLETPSRRYEWTGMEPDQRGYLTIFLPPNEQARSIRVRSAAGRVIRQFDFTAQGDRP
jgi:hypothetical protein